MRKALLLRTMRCISASTLLVLIGTAACATVSTPESGPPPTKIPEATVASTGATETEPVATSIPPPDPTVSPTATKLGPTPTAKPEPTVALIFPVGEPPSQETTIPLIISPYSELEAALPWVEGELTTSEESNLTQLRALFDQDQASALTMVEFLWIQDGMSRVERKAVEYLADMVSEGIDLGALITAIWFIDGIDKIESELLLETRNVARSDSNLATMIIRFPWIADGVQENDLNAVETIGDLVAVDPLLAQKVRRLDWIEDGVNRREQELLGLWTRQAKSDISYANDLIKMPAFRTSVERLDLLAAYSLTDLKNDFPREYKELSKAPWFATGIDDANAPLVHALGRQASFGKYFDDLLGSHKTESLVFRTPKGVEVKVYSYTYKGGSSVTFLRRMEDAVAAMEDLVGAPFPREEIIYVFALPGEDEFSGWHLGTHMLLNWQFAESEPNAFILGLLAFDYWNARYSGTTHVKGPPFWFERGALDFLANYARDRLGLTSLDRHKSYVEGLAKYCRGRGVPTIQDLIDHLEENGIEAHRDSYKSQCNALIADILFVNLHGVMGHEAFSQAWSEIYGLTQSSEGPISEEQIYRAFIGNSDASSLEQVKDVYQKWHGGKF